MRTGDCNDLLVQIRPNWFLNPHGVQKELCEDKLGFQTIGKLVEEVTKIGPKFHLNSVSRNPTARFPFSKGTFFTSCPRAFSRRFGLLPFFASQKTPKMLFVGVFIGKQKWGKVICIKKEPIWVLTFSKGLKKTSFKSPFFSFFP